LTDTLPVWGAAARDRSCEPLAGLLGAALDSSLLFFWPDRIMQYLQLMSPSERKFPDAILDIVEMAISRQETRSVLQFGAALSEMAEIHSCFGRLIESIDHQTGAVTLRLDRIAEGIKALGANFELRMGEILWKLEVQNEKLIELADVLRSPAETEAKERCRTGVNAFRSGWYEDAAKDLQESLRRYRYDFVAHKTLGHIFLEHRPDLKRAVYHFLKAGMYAAPKDHNLAADGYCFAGLAYHKMGSAHLQDAISAFRLAIGLNPDFAAAQFYLSQCWAQADEADAAVAALEEAITREPGLFRRAKSCEILKAILASPSVLMPLAVRAAECQLQSLVISMAETPRATSFLGIMRSYEDRENTWRKKLNRIESRLPLMLASGDITPRVADDLRDRIGRRRPGIVKDPEMQLWIAFIQKLPSELEARAIDLAAALEIIGILMGELPDKYELSSPDSL
jgi:tetratricopeptide (TPR) repeat protein